MRKEGATPRGLAGAAGVLLLVTIVLGVCAERFVSDRLWVPGDAAATASAILGHESLLRLGVAGYLLEAVCQVVMTALFYLLLEPVGRSLALSAALLGLTGCVVKTVSRLFFIAPLLVLGAGDVGTGLTAGQRQDLALFLLDLSSKGAALGLVFFGFQSVVKGFLLVRSRLLPRFVGWSALLAGVGWITFLYPPLALRLFPYIAALALVAAAAQIFWLVAFGVDERVWMAGAAR